MKKRFMLYLSAAFVLVVASVAQEPQTTRAKFDQTLNKMSAAKATVMRDARAHLEERYDLSEGAAAGVAMHRGKPVQEGVRVKLPAGMTWQQLAALAPDAIRKRNLWPLGFMPLPHPSHPEGGMLFPKFHIDEVKKQTDRDLERFDLDFDIPDRFLPEFPPAIFLTTRPDLGDVSQGQLVTSENFNDLFSGIVNPKQLEGLRLLVTPFPQQQFNATESGGRRDRASASPVSTVM